MKPGQQVAGYRIESILGQGGMGTVYEATQLSLNRTVALKIISPQLGADQSFRERFRREGHIQAAIDHPHIVTVFEAGEVGEGGLFLAMRLVRGSTLKDMIVGRDLEGARTLRLLKPIADALDTAHEAGLTHRDIKPQNILVGTRDHAYLADFGLTKSSTETGLTKTGQFVGTIDYISPEQIRGEQAGAHSDIYALTAVLYECLCGVVPYPKPSDAAVLYAHISNAPPLVTDQRPELPPALDEVIARGMAKNPSERHASASEMIADAERAMGKRVRAVITPPGPVENAAELGIRDEESRVSTRESRLRTPRPEPHETTPAKATPAKTTPAKTTPSKTTPGETVTAATTPRARTQRPSEHAGPDARQATDPATQRRRLAAAGLVGVLVLGAAGFALGRAGGEDAGGSSTAAALVGSASNSDVALDLPARWRRMERPPAIPGLELKGAMTVAASPGSDQGLVVGRIDSPRLGFLPESLAMAAEPDAGGGDPVRTQHLQGFRHEGLKVQGYAGTIDVLTAPTSRGTLAFVCYHPAVAAAADKDCERVVASARLVDGKPAEVGPDPAYAGRLNKAFERLNGEVRTRRRGLRAARTPQGQNRAAAGLGRVYKQAADSIRNADPPVLAADANADIARYLKQASEAYARLASSARSGARERYARARRRISQSEQATRRALGRLERIGYARPEDG